MRTNTVFVVGTGRIELPTSCSQSEPHTACVRSDVIKEFVEKLP